MTPPYVELDLSNSQFEIFVAIVNSIRAQKQNQQYGEIEFTELVHLRWNGDSVHFEMKANNEG